MKKLLANFTNNRLKLSFIILFTVGSAFFTLCNAQFNSIVNFDYNVSPQGERPFGNVTRVGNKLYGTTQEGGNIYDGVFFSVDTDGTNYTDMHDFTYFYPSGENPVCSLSYSNGYFYGTTGGGGSDYEGTIFRMDLLGNLTDLYDFTGGTGGQGAYAGVVRAGAKLYGMTELGGNYGDGNIYCIDTDGNNYKDLHDFDYSDGYEPQQALIVIGSEVFGTVFGGGGYGYGSVFKMDTNGTNYTDLYDFNGFEDSGPLSILTQKGGSLYGTTSGYTPYYYSVSGGTIFKIDTDGTNYQDLWEGDFGGDSNMYFPSGDLTLIGNKLYGTSQEGGEHPYNGNLFSIDTDGTHYHEVYAFKGTDGDAPYAGYLLSNGNMYATTVEGGTNGDGTVFRFDPFVKINLIANSITCNGDNNGNATITSVTGGVSPYTYVWAPGGQTTTSLSGLTAGTYTVYAFDTYKTMDSVVVTITEPTVLSVSASTTANASCDGAYQGSASTLVTGGSIPYTYAWTGGAGNRDTADGLSGGTYTLTVTDNHGCTGTASVVITQPVALSATANPTSGVTCFGGSNGSATAAGIAGTGPYTYSWFPSGGTNAAASGLSAGTYTVTVNDICGGSTTAAVTITQANAVAVSANATAGATCNGGSNGSASSNVIGGTSPYTYLWTGGATNSTASGLSAGIYTLTVTDKNGCTGSATTVITQPTALSLTADSAADMGGCTGTAWVNVSGGTSPYTYKWNDSHTTTTFDVKNLCKGTYCCIVTDANGCQDSTCIKITSDAGVDGITSNAGQITLYPNPNNGQFTIKSSVTGQSLVEIYNVLGEKVYTQLSTFSSPLSVNLSTQPNGVYLYRIITENGNLVGEGKIILQK